MTSGPPTGQPPWDQQPGAPIPQWAPDSERYGGPQRTGPNGMAIASLVLGIIGFFYFNVVLGPLAMIFGGIGLNRASRGASGRSMSIAGLALGIFDILIWAIVVIAVRRRLGYAV